VTRKRRGLDALLEILETLQGYPFAASIFESEILAARLQEYKPSDLDTLSAAGEIVWAGVEPLGERDGRIAVYLTDSFPTLSGAPMLELEGVEKAIVEFLANNGASFFAQIQIAVGGFPNDLVDALWNLVWKGAITNDTFHALRAFTRGTAAAKRTTTPRGAFRSRRVAPASTQGRWSLVPPSRANETEKATAIAQQMLARYGVMTREAPGAENVTGGFSAIYPVLRAMEDAGRIRRGYFVAGLGAMQFATAGALDVLRSYRDEPEQPEVALIAATDPANPYGAIVKWPEVPERSLTRSVGASVILVNGALAAYIGRGEKQILTFLPEEEPSRGMVGRAIAAALASRVDEGTRRALLISEVDGKPVARSPLAPFLVDAGFSPSAVGYQKRHA